MIQFLQQADANLPLVKAYREKCEQIENSANLTPKQKVKQVRQLTFDRKWIERYSIFLAGFRGIIRQFHFNAIADLAIGKIEPFDPASVPNFPVFKDPTSSMLPGTSLCRLGFPFHQIQASFDETSSQFVLAPGVLPIPRFPNDGIHTRIAFARSPDGKEEAKFLETSSPGLRGQSGGPIFDKEGNIWALQSRTQHLPLGFAPTVKQGNKEITEHQFMHVGHGAHVEEIIKLFRKHNVSFELSSQGKSDQRAI
jgi:hypothetical protein